MDHLLKIQQQISECEDPDSLPRSLTVHLDLQDEVDGLSPFSLLISVIESLPELVSVEMAQCNLGNDLVRELFDCLMAAQTVESVNLAGNGLTDVAVDSLAELIVDRAGTGAPLQTLNLTGNGITEDSISIIQEALSVSPDTRVQFGPDVATSSTGASGDDTAADDGGEHDTGTESESTTSSAASNFRTLGKGWSFASADDNASAATASEADGGGQDSPAPPPAVGVLGSHEPPAIASSPSSRTVPGSRVALRMDPAQAQAMIRRLEGEVDRLTAEVSRLNDAHVADNAVPPLSGHASNESSATAAPPVSEHASDESSTTTPKPAVATDLSEAAAAWLDDPSKRNALLDVAKARGYPLCTLRGPALQATIDGLVPLVREADATASSLRVLRSQTLSKAKLRTAQKKGVDVAQSLAACFTKAVEDHAAMDHSEENASILVQLLEKCNAANDSYTALRSSLGVNKKS